MVARKPVVDHPEGHEMHSIDPTLAAPIHLDTLYIAPLSYTFLADTFYTIVLLHHL